MYDTENGGRAMNLSIHFDEPYIRREQISRLQPTDLNDFYASAS